MFNLYNHIKELSEKSGFETIEDLCKAAGIRSTVTSNLKAKGPEGTITVRTAKRLADALGVSVDTIFGREEKKLVTEIGNEQKQSIDFSKLSKEQQDVIQEVLQMDAQSLSAARPLIESLLFSQQARDNS